MGGDSTTTFFENGIQYRCHRFTSTGVYTLWTSSISAGASFDFCLVGGGGNGGIGSNNNAGGGGGAGCLIVAYHVPFTTLSNITGSVGTAGSASTIVLPEPNRNPNSTVRTISASGGAVGGNASQHGVNADFSYTNLFPSVWENLGASGSGAGSGVSSPGGAAPGGTNSFASTDFSKLLFGGGKAGGQAYTTGGGGGGGGVGSQGSPASNTSPVGGNGGAGFALLFDGTIRAVCCGGGGGGGGAPLAANIGQGGKAGNIESGGDGGNSDNSPTAGAANTGSGGGGSFNSTTTNIPGGVGGTGLVMIRYVIG